MERQRCFSLSLCLLTPCELPSSWPCWTWEFSRHWQLPLYTPREARHWYGDARTPHLSRCFCGPQHWKCETQSGGESRSLAFFFLPSFLIPRGWSPHPIRHYAPLIINNLCHSFCYSEVEIIDNITLLAELKSISYSNCNKERKSKSNFSLYILKYKQMLGHNYKERHTELVWWLSLYVEITWMWLL